MNQQINQRLAELNQQFEQGNARLLRIDRERAELRESLLRIQGAILALKEFHTDADSHDVPQEAVAETAEICIPFEPEDKTVED